MNDGNRGGQGRGNAPGGRGGGRGRGNDQGRGGRGGGAFHERGGGQSRGGASRGRGAGGAPYQPYGGNQSRGGGGGDYHSGGGRGGAGRGAGGDRGGGGRTNAIYPPDPPFKDFKAEKSKHATGQYMYTAVPSEQLQVPSTITKLEDDTLQARQRLPDIGKLTLGPDSDRTLDTPSRPNYGNTGTAIILRTNYVDIPVTRDLVVYRYAMHAAFVTAAGETRTRTNIPGRILKRAVQLFIRQPQFDQIRTGLATDHKAILISVFKLQQDQMEATFKFTHEDEDTNGNDKGNSVENRSGTLRVWVEQMGPLVGDTNEDNGDPDPPVRFVDLIDYLKSSDGRSPPATREQLKSILNVILNYQAGDASPEDTLSLGQRHFKVADGATTFNGSQHQMHDHTLAGAGLDIHRGYYASVRFAASRVLLNIQVRNTVVKQAGPLATLVQNVGRGDLPNLERFVKKLRVRTTHIPNQKRVKVVDGLAKETDGNQGDSRHPPRVRSFGAGPRDVSFYLNSHPNAAASKSLGLPAYVTVADFFKAVYNIAVDASYPVVNVGPSPKQAVYLPVDVCVVLAGQPSTGALDATQTKHMIAFSVRSPAENARDIINKGPGVLRLVDNPTLDAFRIGLVRRLLTVSGRVLGQPPVRYLNRNAEVRNAAWNMGNLKFSRPAAMVPWAVVILSSNASRVLTVEQIRDPLEWFAIELKNCGVTNVSTPTSILPVHLNGASATWTTQLQQEFNRRKTGEKCRLIFVVMPSKVGTSEMYAAVKCAADVHVGIHTVCAVGSRFVKLDNRNGPDKQYYANVALKFNLKLGGANQTMMPRELSEHVGKGSIMLVGLDVTHPSPNSSETAPSVAAMVASCDAHFAQFPGVIRVQGRREEMVSGVGEMFQACLRTYFDRNQQTLPDNIIVYRDGVSEGQYDLVRDVELRAMHKIIGERYPPEARARITVIICGKRHNTRFYPTTLPTADATSNLKSGTVVDRGITQPHDWEFFLQAHSALQGTARPCHYFVLHDEIFTRPENSRGGEAAGDFERRRKGAANHVEHFTHNFCYMFGRATRAVSYCPPAYYADMLCERARCYLRSEFEPDRGQAQAQAPPANAQQVAALKERHVKAATIHENLQRTMIYI